MNRDDTTAKEKILRAAMELVSEGRTDRQITMREIACRAGVNLALVNYHYHSKENLLSQVVGTMMGGIIAQYSKDNRGETDARTKLTDMLLSTAEAAFHYGNIAKIAISAELKEGCRNSCEMVMPFLREILPDCGEPDIRIIALQLMIPFHHIVLNPALLGAYLQTDFSDDLKRKQKIDQMIDCALSGRM